MSSSQLTNSYFSEGWPNHQPDYANEDCFDEILRPGQNPVGEFPKVGQAMGLQRQVRKGGCGKGRPTSWDGWGESDISLRSMKQSL